MGIFGMILALKVFRKFNAKFPQEQKITLRDNFFALATFRLRNKKIKKSRTQNQIVKNYYLELL